jgi:hypothetical protein
MFNIVDVLSKLGDVQVVFDILFRCSAQRPSFLFCYSPPLSSFWSQFIVFYSTFMGVFEKIVGLGSLEWLETLLVHW